ncbi:12523_t:CDS:2, partial [Gigaspora margarita]
KNRFTDDDRKKFNEFKEAFNDVDYFGDYPTIGVNFPSDKEDDNNDKQQKKKRMKSTKSKLSKVLGSLELIEDKVQRCIGFVPGINIYYKIGSSGIYYLKGKPKIAKKRLVERIWALVTTAAFLPINTTEYLDQNYPKGNRSQIIELDISHKSLEDKFNSINFSDLRIINCSFNQLTRYFGGWRSTVEIFDCSYNLFLETWLFVTTFLQKLNLSHNKMDGIKITQNAITHFDVSDNTIFELDLSESGNLQILNCSYNPLTKLILPDSFDSISFDCSNILFKKVETNSFIFDCQTGTKIIRNTASSLPS